MTKVLTRDIIQYYREIMQQEIKIRPKHDPRPALHKGTNVVKLGDEFFCTATRIFEIAKSATVPRSYNFGYNLCKDTFIYESVSAHTNLVSEIATAALDFAYGHWFGAAGHKWVETIDGYSYREIMEVVRLHDLAENETGDLPDNGTRDEAKKQRQELIYIREYLNSFLTNDETSREKVLKLFQEMQGQSSPTGRLIYLADKVAALMITLCLDHLGHSPMILSDSPYVSERDQAEMERCDFAMGHAYKASEMWCIDFFQMRNIVRYDDDFFFTALIVMATLMVNEKWYKWRETDYI